MPSSESSNIHSRAHRNASDNTCPGLFSLWMENLFSSIWAISISLFSADYINTLSIHIRDIRTNGGFRENQAFTKATQLSTQTEETFQKVATLLGKSKKLGPQHDLTIEWDSLRQVRHSSSTTSYYMLIVVCENPNRLGEVLLKKRERMLVESRPSYLVRNP